VRRRARARPVGRLDDVRRRVGECRDDPRYLEPRKAKPIEALMNELVQVRGDRQLLAGVEVAAAPL
jgi:hypothetical protein